MLWEMSTLPTAEHVVICSSLGKMIIQVLERVHSIITDVLLLSTLSQFADGFKVIFDFHLPVYVYHFLEYQQVNHNSVRNIQGYHTGKQMFALG